MSHQVIQLIPQPRPALLAARRILVGAALIAVGYVGAHMVPSPVDSLFAAGFGSTVSAKHYAPSSSDRKSPVVPREGAGEGAIRRDFDYFPDHYRNQGKEVDENVSTF